MAEGKFFNIWFKQSVKKISANYSKVVNDSTDAIFLGLQGRGDYFTCPISSALRNPWGQS